MAPGRARPAGRGHRRGLLALNGIRAAVALGLAFLGLTAVVVVAGSVPGEQGLLRAAASYSWLRPAARVVDAGTGYVPMAVVAVLLAAALAARSRRLRGLFALAAVGGAIATTTLLKHLVGRERPDLLPAGADVSTLSYPSGHAAATAAVGLVVVLLAGRRWVVPVLAAVAVAGVAQLVLGRHHPSDVLGGWLWAAAWTSGLWWLLGRRSIV